MQGLPLHNTLLPEKFSRDLELITTLANNLKEKTLFGL